MADQDKIPEEMDFGAEVAKILPLIQREASKRMSPIFSEISLSIPQYFFLGYLTERDSCTMGDIAQLLNLSMGAATGIVDRMIELNLVRRNRSKEDRRVVNVSIEDKGKEVIKKCNAAHRDIINDIFSGLTLEERTEYLRILRKIHNNIERRNESTP